MVNLFCFKCKTRMVMLNGKLHCPNRFCTNRKQISPKTLQKLIYSRIKFISKKLRIEKNKSNDKLTYDYQKNKVEAEIICNLIKDCNLKWDLSIRQFNNATIDVNTLNSNLTEISLRKDSLEVESYETNLLIWLYENKELMQTKIPILSSYLQEECSQRQKETDLNQLVESIYFLTNTTSYAFIYLKDS